MAKSMGLKGFPSLIDRHEDVSKYSHPPLSSHTLFILVAGSYLRRHHGLVCPVSNGEEVSLIPSLPLLENFFSSLYPILETESCKALKGGGIVELKKQLHVPLL